MKNMELFMKQLFHTGVKWCFITLLLIPLDVYSVW